MILCSDFYAQNLQLTLDGKNKFKSHVGGILTFITLIIVIVFSWLIGKDIYFKENPFYYQQNLNLPHYQKVDLNYSSFSLAFSLFHINGNIMDDDRFLKIKLTYNQIQLDEEGMLNTNPTQIELKKCTLENFPSVDQSAFDSQSLGLQYCPAQFNLTLSGYWTQYPLNYLSLGIFECDEITNPEYCASSVEKENYIKENGISFGMLFLDYSVSVNNYSYPNPSLFTNPYKFLTKDMKIVNYMIKSDKILTDSGFIFESISEVNYLKVYELQSDTLLYSESLRQLAEFNFYSSNMSTVSIRKYIKISEIIASVGGILKILNIIFSIINVPFSKINRNLKIIEKLFVEVPELNKENQVISVFKPIKKKEDPIIFNKIHNLDSFKYIINLHQNTKPNFRLSAIETLKMPCIKIKKSKNKKARIYGVVSNKIECDLDLINIYKTIQITNNIKKLLLKDYESNFLDILKFNLNNIKEQSEDFKIEKNIISNLNINNLISEDKRFLNILELN
jgi:hypothetical protein